MDVRNSSNTLTLTNIQQNETQRKILRKPGNAPQGFKLSKMLRAERGSDVSGLVIAENGSTGMEK